MVRNLMRTPRSRVLVLGIVGLVLAALFFGTGLMGRRNRAASPPEASPEGGFDVSVKDSRKVVGFVERYGQRIEETERTLREKSAHVQVLQAQLDENRKAMAEFRQDLEAIRSREAPTENPKAPRTRREDPPKVAIPFLPGTSPEGPPSPASSLPRLEKLTLPGAQDTEPDQKHGRDVVIPAGSFAEGRLMTGVYAPTTDAAQPVLLKIDTAFVGPNRSRIPIKNAFLVGKAVGEPNSVRAVIQFHKLSYVRGNGESIEVPLNGFVAGEAGTQGLAGTYHWRIREAAGLAALTGGVSAAAEAAAERETTTLVNPLGGVAKVVTGDIGKFAAARGVSRASDEVGRIITRRLGEIVPAVYVENGRRLTVILIDGVTLEGLPVDELENETSRSPYAGLDFHR